MRIYLDVTVRFYSYINYEIQSILHLLTASLKFLAVPEKEILQEVNTTLRLNCTAEGPPHTKVTWYKVYVQRFFFS